MHFFLEPLVALVPVGGDAEGAVFGLGFLSFEDTGLGAGSSTLLLAVGAVGRVAVPAVGAAGGVAVLAVGAVGEIAVLAVGAEGEVAVLAVGDVGGAAELVTFFDTGTD